MYFKAEGRGVGIEGLRQIRFPRFIEPGKKGQIVFMSVRVIDTDIYWDSLSRTGDLTV